MENVGISRPLNDHSPEEHMLRCVEMFDQYELMLASLSNTVQFYQEEVQTLKSELISQMDENKIISNQLEEAHKNNLELEKLCEKYKFDANFIENLKEQLATRSQEKKNVEELWQSSLKTIDCLEKELSLCRGNNKDGYVSQSYLKQEKQKHEEELKSLQMNLERIQEKLKDTVHIHTELLKAKNEELERVCEENKKVKKQIESFEMELKNLRMRQSELDTIQKRFVKILEEKQNQIECLVKREAEIKTKMNETLIIIESAVAERDAAILRETRNKEETERKQSELNKTLLKQLQSVEKSFDEKESKLKNELKELKCELSRKDLELEKFKSECEILRSEIKRIRDGNIYIDETNTSRMLIMDKNMENTFQKLIISEKKCLQLAAERDSLKSDLEQIANVYSNDIKSSEIEKASLKNKITNLKNELDLSKKSMLIITEKFEKLGNDIENITLENKKSLLAKDQKNQRTLEEMNEMERKFETIQKLTEKHLDLHMEITNKWQKGMEETTRKFEERISQLKQESKDIKKKNLHLEKALQISNATMQEYKKVYDQMCGVAEKIKEIAEV